MPRARDATSARFARRKEALKRKAQELATRCDVDVAVICAAPGDLGLVWPSNQAVLATVRRYNALSSEERASHLEDSADHFARRLEKELDKLVRAQEGGVAGALGSWDGSLEGMDEEELRQLLASIDGSLAAARSRALERQPQSGGAPDRDSIPPSPVHADEVTAETSVSVRARAASNGARRRPGKADAGGDVSAPPLEENPKAPNAAPLVADQVTAETSVPAPALGAGNAGGDALELPLEENPGAPNAAPLVADDAAEGGEESEDVQILQPPADADADDDEGMRDLVEALKETPRPSNAAPYYSETKYLYMGRGYAMERDASDFIYFDLGMPPPCILPDSPDSDDDEPLKLWPWE